VDDDDPSPVPSVWDRFDRWAVAIGATRPLSPVRLPGRAGCYVVFGFPGPL
jgi:hypothetical protein